mmetsp:Transcript_41134/g.117034  ORF Transcript_41134/g.117034 Transcript_41134/m.117034 type:complete len:244 (+) Transcript_41134:42-773(+)
MNRQAPPGQAVHASLTPTPPSLQPSFAHAAALRRIPAIAPSSSAPPLVWCSLFSLLLVPLLTWLAVSPLSAREDASSCKGWTGAGRGGGGTRNSPGSISNSASEVFGGRLMCVQQRKGLSCHSASLVAATLLLLLPPTATLLLLAAEGMGVSSSGALALSLSLASLSAMARLSDGQDDGRVLRAGLPSRSLATMSRRSIPVRFQKRFRYSSLSLGPLTTSCPPSAPPSLACPSLFRLAITFLW